MQRPERNCSQDEQIESAGKKLSLVVHQGPPKMIRKVTRTLLSCQGESALPIPNSEFDVFRFWWGRVCKSALSA
jgi:hypothetical protein